MIMDNLLEFADATALSTASDSASVLLGDVVDTNVCQSGNVLTDIGNGRPMYWVISVDTDIAGVSGTSTFQLCSDSTANLATSKTVHITSPTFTTAQLVAGMTWVAPLPPGCSYERYLGVWHTQATATITAGKINSFLTLDPPVQKHYLDAVP